MIQLFAPAMRKSDGNIEFFFVAEAEVLFVLQFLTNICQNVGVETFIYKMLDYTHKSGLTFRTP